MEEKKTFTGIMDGTSKEQMFFDMGEDQIILIDVGKIMPNPIQFRRHIDEEKLKSLAGNIKKYGVLQPIIVKRRGESYLIIAGERRWRAAGMAGLRSIPAIMCNDDDVMVTDEIAITENMQRENLNVVDEIFAIKELFDRGKTTEEIMELTSRSKRHVMSAKRSGRFLEMAMSNGWTSYLKLIDICSKYGMKTVEQAARIWEATDDLQQATEVLEGGSAKAVAEQAEIASIEAEERALEQKERGTSTGPSPAASPYETQYDASDGASGEPSDAAGHEDEGAGLSGAGSSDAQGPEPDFDVLDPFATPGPASGTVMDSPEKNTQETPLSERGIPGENDTKYTQNREFPENGSDTTLFEPPEKPIKNDGFSPGTEEHLPDSGTGDFKGKGVEEEEGAGEQGRGDNPHETEGRGQDTSQLSGGNGKISGKLVIKRFTALKSLMEEVSG